MDAVELRGFGFSYPGCAPVLQGIDLRIESGSFALIVGRTGSGKTTLLKCLKPEIAPVGERAGSAQVFGRSVAAADGVSSNSLVGYVFQNPENQIVCDTVLHELVFGLENAGIDPDAMRRRVAETAAFFGIEPWLHAQTAELSGGQKQLVNLAGILALQPRLLLLDEPTAQLDPIAEKNFLHALFRINRELGITVAVATHAPESMADYATEAFCIAEGRIESVSPATGTAKGAGANSIGEAGVAETPPSAMEPLAATRPSAAAQAYVATPPSAANPAVAATTPSAKLAAATPPSVAPEDAAAACIEAADVFFRYAREAAWVLKGADIRVRQGGVHALVGGNGSGKSTMLRLMAGVLKPERGSLRNALRNSQVLLPQDPKALFVCDSVGEELREWQKIRGYGDEAVAQAVHRFGFDGLEGRHPFDLSGGQQQNLAFAKLLLTDPELLLLDEPTKGLDAPSKLKLAENLTELHRQGKTIVFSTHDLAFLSVMATEVSMLFDGEVVSTEKTASFFSENLFYRYREDEFLRLWRAENADGTAS
ncbi:ABC transporter ATP-binding protein [Raoultibacter phocaeensis]|uniref:ABC transporter ATP-binding protein n=1 Tax=Raoultibacter phocaeensis TaxID=2479841 RepID=UPI0015D61122|nr:ATP-binding cassette domain-containing protein [Raoultibacter phocaeensis]